MQAAAKNVLFHYVYLLGSTKISANNKNKSWKLKQHKANLFLFYTYIFTKLRPNKQNNTDILKEIKEQRKMNHNTKINETQHKMNHNTKNTEAHENNNYHKTNLYKETTQTIIQITTTQSNIYVLKFWTNGWWI